jgi:hypothetical protein
LKKLIWCLVWIFALAAVIPAFEKGVSANNLKIITDTDIVLIYEIIEDGVTFRYKEYTYGNQVDTYKYEVVGSTETLIENTGTTLDLNNDTLVINFTDNLTNSTHETTLNIQEIENSIKDDLFYIDDPEVPLTESGLKESESMMKASYTGTWRKSYGTRMAYY